MIRSIRPALAACVALVVSGCGGGADGPDMGEVSGVVKLDGQPLPGALITFAPQGEGGAQSGSMSYGLTDDQGAYTLEYSGSKTGAVVGTHLVRITTYRQAGEDDEGNETPGVPEQVAADYNVRAAENPDMKKEVKAGANEINFDLESGGEIIQPAADDE